MTRLFDEGEYGRLSKQPQYQFVLLLSYFAAALLLSLLLFYGKINNYFASDDWPAILRNSTFTWQQLPAWFTTLRAGWYRPVHDLFISMNWQLFGLNPVGYRLVSIFAYALVSTAVGLFMLVLTRDRRAGFLAVILFTLYAPHAEAVLWFAGTNELLAAFFVLISITAYLTFRSQNKPAWIALSCLSGYLAFASKETALFFPVLFIFYDVLLFFETEKSERSGAFFLPLLPVFIIWVGFLLFRIPLGSAYETSFEFSLPGMAKNAVYYLLIGVLTIPNNYAFLSSVDLWRAAPLLPAAALVVSLSLVVLLLFIWIKSGGTIWKRYRIGLWLTAVWSITALGPVIFIVTERAAFLPSVGIVALYTILIVGAWDVTKSSRTQTRTSLAVLVGLFLVLNGYVLTYRSGWFEKSGALNQNVLTQLNHELTQLPPDARILIVDLPDHTQHTFTFRNTFPNSTRLMQVQADVGGILDSELSGKSDNEKQAYIHRIAAEDERTIIFWYQDGQLVRD